MNVLVTITIFYTFGVSFAKLWMFQSEKKWDAEWRKGEWDYMETVAVERSRVAVIGGVFAYMYVPANGSVLDIGCGEGAIADFLKPGQQQHYVGVDISNEAIQIAKKKRPDPMKFEHANVYEYKPNIKFDMIIFSDVLYYVDYEKVIAQYATYLTANGVMVISIFHLPEAGLGKYENIFNFARNHLLKVDETDVSGYTKKKVNGVREKTTFHIEVFKLGEKLSQ